MYLFSAEDERSVCFNQAWQDLVAHWKHMAQSEISDEVTSFCYEGLYI